MTISPTHIRFDEHLMWIDLTDGRHLGVPLVWFPRLLNATPAQRCQVEISRVGLHWEIIDEDISIAGLLAGQGDRHSTKNIRWIGETYKGFAHLQLLVEDCCMIWRAS